MFRITEEGFLHVLGTARLKMETVSGLSIDTEPISGLWLEASYKALLVKKFTFYTSQLTYT